MSPELLCDTLHLTLPALFECEPASRGGVRVQTPMLYPDGSEVQVHVLQREEQVVVTDHGDVLGWLRMQTSAQRLSPGVRKRIGEICDLQGATLERGRLIERCTSPTEVADAVHRVGMAMVRIADIASTFGSRSRSTVADEVDEWLREREFTYEREVRVQGHSRKWRADYRVVNDARTSLVFLLSARNRNAVRNKPERVLATCVDLTIHLAHQQKLALVSLFDDTTGIWRDKDFRLLESHSEVARWSNPKALERILQPVPEDQ